MILGVKSGNLGHEKLHSALQATSSLPCTSSRSVQLCVLNRDFSPRPLVRMTTPQTALKRTAVSSSKLDLIELNHKFWHSEITKSALDLSPKDILDELCNLYRSKALVLQSCLLSRHVWPWCIQKMSARPRLAADPLMNHGPSKWCSVRFKQAFLTNEEKSLSWERSENWDGKGFWLKACGACAIVPSRIPLELGASAKAGGSETSNAPCLGCPRFADLRYEVGEGKSIEPKTKQRDGVFPWVALHPNTPSASAPEMDPASGVPAG